MPAPDHPTDGARVTDRNRSNRCPECGARPVNVQGIADCPECLWASQSVDR